MLRYLLPAAVLLVLWAHCLAADPPRAGRLEVTVTESGGGRLPCRVYLTAGGKAVYADRLPRFERDGHFSCPGEFAVDLPAGPAGLRIERGLEYRPFTAELTIEPGRTLKQPVRLERWIDMNARGWYSGDLHVHRPVGEMPLLMRADDLNVAPVLTHWNNRHDQVPKPYLVEAGDDGAASPKPRWFHKLAQEDERAGGAIMLFNLREPVLLTDVTRNAPSGFAYHAAGIEQKAFVEVEKPFWWEAPVHVALGKVDAIGVVCNHFQRTGLMDNEAWGRPRDKREYPGPRGFARNVLDLYYRYLDLGWRIAPSAGSATGVLRNPLGANRAYVPLERFDHDAWYEALRAGRGFVTNGPVIFATVNGKPIGHRFDVPAGGALDAAVEIEVLGRDPLEQAEIVLGGKVVATFRPGEGNPRRIAARHGLKVGRSTWLAVRAWEPAPGSVVHFAHTAPFYVTVGGKRPCSADAARFYVQWLDELIARWQGLRNGAPDPKAIDTVLETYRKARAVYQAKAAGRKGSAPQMDADENL